MNRIRTSMIATLSFFNWKYLYPLYRSVDAMIHQALSLDGIHPQISLPLRLLVLCVVRSDLFVINFCLFFQRNRFFHWLPWQMPHQRFQRFDFSSQRTMLLVGQTWCNSSIASDNLLCVSCTCVHYEDSLSPFSIPGKLSIRRFFASCLWYMWRK